MVDYAAESTADIEIFLRKIEDNLENGMAEVEKNTSVQILLNIVDNLRQFRSTYPQIVSKFESLNKVGPLKHVVLFIDSKSVTFFIIVYLDISVVERC